MTERAKQRQPFPAGTPATLNLVAWTDPVVQHRGHKPGSPYIEIVWLGILGPSAALCWERLSRVATAKPETIVDTTDLAISLGLSGSLGRNAPLTRTLDPLIMFSAASNTGDLLAVRRALPDIPQRMVGRFSYTARLAHERLGRPHPATELAVKMHAPPAIEVSP